MLSEKKFLSAPKLYDYNGDLTKKWFVGYRDSQGKQRKIQKGINGQPTAKDRRLFAKEIIENLINKEKARLYHKPRKKVLDYVELRRPSWTDKTYRGYLSKCTVFFEWLENRPVNKDTIKLFFREYLMQRKGKTYNNYKVQLSLLFREALNLDTEYIFKDIEKRKDNCQTPVYFSTNQIEFLSKQLKKTDNSLWLFTQFIYYCFMRPGTEVRLLKVGDVMLDEKKIIVHGDVAKNNKTRYVQIPLAFQKVLEVELKDRDFREYIFHSGNPYKPLGNNTTRKRHMSVLKKNGFDTRRYKLYGWKNTGMVQAIKAGYPLKWIQLQAGHHSLEQTDNYLRNMGISTVEADLSKFPSM